MSREIYVFGDWEELGKIQQIGLLRVDQVRGKETFSFEYNEEWLGSGAVMSLDPELQLYSGPQYLAEQDKPNFGLFLDSSPDRWGKLLMKRWEAMEARTAKREERRLLESDYLLGVHDEQRMGGLRFKENLAGPFLSDADGMTAPPWTKLRELEEAARRIQSSDSIADPKMREWLKVLVAPGSSIGGARPKAGVCDEKDDLWIAKFPGRNDEWDVGAWEMVVHQLAANAGLDIAEARVERFGKRHHTFITKRFDRGRSDGNRTRRHFASAMTMLGYTDGTDFSDGASYLEIVEFLMQHGAIVDSDLNELWRRIVFSICVRNVDDHLRNHGFLLDSRGWQLAPAYDLNPSPIGTGLSLNISETDNSLSLDLALEVKAYFRLSDDAADNTIKSIQESVSGWRSVASGLGITKAEQDLMSQAFTSG